jgi:hypothetical protein
MHRRLVDAARRDLARLGLGSSRAHLPTRGAYRPARLASSTSQLHEPAVGDRARRLKPQRRQVKETSGQPGTVGGEALLELQLSLTWKL